MKQANFVKSNATSDEIIQCPISIERTWQKRGHSPFNGVVTAISILTGKCIDAAVFFGKAKKGQQGTRIGKQTMNVLLIIKDHLMLWKLQVQLLSSVGLLKNISCNILVTWVMGCTSSFLKY